MFELIFHPGAAEELYALDPVMQAKVLRGLEKLEREGFRMRYPDSRALSGGLYELRLAVKILLVRFLLMQPASVFIYSYFYKKDAKNAAT
ncbi:type II toxin-antitoxin system RelE/ParE family toxin [Cronobacter sakazakii]|uniref:type II toxin-antitoxin system RelE/ParE family toxin n=1 Tax=Cronobacter sakazakii TaxID=28141 RepID=UPI000CFBD51B|nr:type II toxin-antitoxin system RelE/ParE family toxin [Cronobacter sakazakii]